ncbi:MAG: hypothetical protein ACE5I3_00230 [Phycisphaerae bacterium]
MPVRQTGSNKLRPGDGGTPPTPASLRRFSVLAALTVLARVVVAASADEPAVTITGGADGTGQFYEWKVTNNHTSPVVYIEFPHFRGDTFSAPAGWAQEWKNRAMVGGGKPAPGWVRTSVKDPAQGISPGDSARFVLRVSRAGADRRPGKVTVRFADRTEVTVADVELPTAKSFLERNVMGIGLAAIFALALLVHFRRRRKPSPARAFSPPSASGEE